MFFFFLFDVFFLFCFFFFLQTEKLTDSVRNCYVQMRSIRKQLSTVVEERTQEMWIPANVPVKIPGFAGGGTFGSKSNPEDTVTFRPSMTAEEARGIEDFQKTFNSCYLVRKRQRTVNLEPCLLFVTHDHTVVNFGNPNTGSEVYVPQTVLEHRQHLRVSGMEDLVQDLDGGEISEPAHPRMVWNPDEHCVYVIGGVGGPKTSPGRHYHSTLERFEVGQLDNGNGSRLSCFLNDLRWTNLSPSFESQNSKSKGSESQRDGGELTHYGTFAACMYDEHLVVSGGFRKPRSQSSASVRRRRSDHVSAFRPGGAFVWRSLAPLPLALSSSAMVSFQGSLFVVGGVDDTGCAVRSVFKLDGLQSLQWTCESTMQHPRKLAAVFSDAKHLFVFGGIDGRHGEWLDSVEMFDPGLDTWTLLPPMPQPLKFPYAFEVFGEVFVVGKNAGAPVFKFCRQTKRWEKKPMSFFDGNSSYSAGSGGSTEIGVRGQFVLVGQHPSCSLTDGGEELEGEGGGRGVEEGGTLR